MIRLNGLIVQYEHPHATVEVLRSDPQVVEPGALIQVALGPDTLVSWAAYEGTPQRAEGDIRPNDSVAARIRPDESGEDRFIAESFAVGISA